MLTDRETSKGNGSIFCTAEMLEQNYIFSFAGYYDNRPPPVPEMDLGSPSGQRPSLDLFKDITHLSVYLSFFTLVVRRVSACCQMGLKIC